MRIGHRVNRAKLALLAGVLLMMAGCGGRSQPEPAQTPVRPTITPAPTPLPPLPTLPSLGSVDNPLVMLFVVDEPARLEARAESLSEAFSSDEAAVAVHLTDNTGEAYQALCSGAAQVVSLNAFGALAALDAECGEALYVVERDGEQASRGQMITAIGRNIFTVDGFRGQEFCRASAMSVDGWIIPSLVMQTRGIDPFSELPLIVDSGSDEAVVNGIFTRECDVGATALGAEEGIPNPNPTTSGRIYVVEELPAVPYDSVFLSSQIEGSNRALLLDALRAETDGLARLLDADALLETGDSLFDELADLFEDAGVDTAALSE